MNEKTLLYLSVLLVLEIVEASWQKGNTFREILKSLRKVYDTHIFLFFLLHPTFYFAIFVSLQENLFNWPMSTIVVLKFFDMAIKLSLIQKEKEGTLPAELPIDEPIHPLLKYIALLLYPLILYFALS